MFTYLITSTSITHYYSNKFNQIWHEFYSRKTFCLPASSTWSLTAKRTRGRVISRGHKWNAYHRNLNIEDVNPLAHISWSISHCCPDTSDNLSIKQYIHYKTFFFFLACWLISSGWFCCESILFPGLFSQGSQSSTLHHILHQYQNPRFSDGIKSHIESCQCSNWFQDSRYNLCTSGLHCLVDLQL